MHCLASEVILSQLLLGSWVANLVPVCVCYNIIICTMIYVVLCLMSMLLSRGLAFSILPSLEPSLEPGKFLKISVCQDSIMTCNGFAHVSRAPVDVSDLYGIWLLPDHQL